MSHTPSAATLPHEAGAIRADRAPVPDAGMPEDEEFAELHPRRRIRRVTQAAALVVALCVAYTGGVMVQKSHDAKLTSATTSALPNFGAGGPGGGGATASTASSGPAVIGTIRSVSGDTVTVTDLGGTTHVVHLTSTTTITQSTMLAASGLKPGATVSVDGSKSADGSVNATAVTSR